MIRDYSKGQIILFQNDPVRYMYVLIFGAVKLYTIEDNGIENILTILSAPDTFPLSRLIGRSNAEFYYEALSDCRLQVIPAEKFKDDDSITRQAIELYFEALHRIASLSARTAEERIVGAYQYIEGHNVRPTHQLVSGMANTSRETASIHLKGKRKQKK